MKFPKMHIAESAVNRILNAWDDVRLEPDPVIPAPEPMEAAPAVPDPAPVGEAVEIGLDRMAGAAGPATPEGGQVAAAGAQGESPMDGLLGALGGGPEGA